MPFISKTQKTLLPCPFRFSLRSLSIGFLLPIFLKDELKISLEKKMLTSSCNWEVGLKTLPFLLIYYAFVKLVIFEYYHTMTGVYVVRTRRWRDEDLCGLQRSPRVPAVPPQHPCRGWVWALYTL